VAGPACRTPSVTPPRITVPVRAIPEFGATCRFTVPAPAPVDGCSESQVSTACAVQVHPPGATTFRSMVPPVAPSSAEEAETSKRHAAGSWESSIR
jgi:hypothetical protein